MHSLIIISPMFYSNDLSEPVNKKSIFIILWLLCIAGALALFPYAIYLIRAQITLKFLLLGLIQAAFAFGIVCWLSYLVLPKTDLYPFKRDNLLKAIVYPGILYGVIASLAILFLDKTIFRHSFLSGIHSPPFWMGFLASFYGAINEEVLLRLFLFTFVYFLLKKIFKFESHKRLYFLWIANIITAFLFGVGHLPLAFNLTSPGFFEIFRIIILNAIPGLVFGWLYWSRGLWAAMTAHFTADLMLHVILL